MCKINGKVSLRFGISIFLVAISSPSSHSQAARPDSHLDRADAFEQTLQIVHGVNSRAAELLRTQYQGRIQESENRDSYRKYYKPDKKAVNATLDEVLSMMELGKGGQSALHMGGIKLQELISVHNQYALGDPEKLARLNTLKAEVHALKIAYSRLSKLVLTQDQIMAVTNGWMPDEVGRTSKLLIENQFLVHSNYVHVSGIKVGIGAMWGGEVGFGLGRLQTTFGKNYTIGGLQGSHGFVTGPSVSFTQHFGCLRGNKTGALVDGRLWGGGHGFVLAIGVGGGETEKPIDFIRGGHEPETIRLREITLCPFKFGEQSGMKTGRLFPIPGRSYKRVREQLGITYAPTMRVHQE